MLLCSFLKNIHTETKLFLTHCLQNLPPITHVSTVCYAMISRSEDITSNSFKFFFNIEIEKYAGVHCKQDFLPLKIL
jgi:hypothetical protein